MLKINLIDNATWIGKEKKRRLSFCGDISEVAP
jgi:hypothetical protein